MNLIFFGLIELSAKKDGNCINAHSALLQTFSDLFSVDNSINRKNIRFISYLIFNAFRDSEHLCKPLINNGLFLTFKVVERYIKSQLSLKLMPKSPQFFNQSEQALRHHSYKY